MKDKIKNKKIGAYFRRIVQLVCFLLLPALFIQIFMSIKAIIMMLFHHQGTFQAILPNIILFVVATIVTAIAGRFFCGWMCAFGSMGDFLYRIPRLKSKNPRRYMNQADQVLKWIKYLLFGIIVILVWGLQLVSIPSGSNPWDLFGMLSAFGNWPSVNELIKGWIPAAIILLLIMAASLFVERFFCRYLCPLGAYFSIISRLRLLTIIKKRENCKKCTYCTTKCSMGIDLKSRDKVTTGECINCMECTIQCPRGNAHMEMSGENRNFLVAGTLSCALVAGSYYLGNFYETQLTGSSGNAFSNTAIVDTVGIAADIPDGTYTGSGNGFRGQTTVNVGVSGNMITSITIESTSDDSNYVNKASSSIISEIISNQSADVDTVSGATFSSKGIISAVKAALAYDESGDLTADSSGAAVTPEAGKASEDSSSKSEAGNSSLKLTDGTYEGSGTGYRGKTKVTVKVSNGKISDITIDSYQDDKKFFNSASTTVIQEIVDNQSVNVDAVSGATYSSNGIKEAVANALNIDFTRSTIENEGHGNGKVR